MKIVILSTNERYSWGGSDEVWFAMSTLALAEGHAVILGAHEKVANSGPVSELKLKGLEVTSRNPFNPHFLYRIKQKILPAMAALMDCDVLLINGDCLYDLFDRPWLHDFVSRYTGPKIFLCHFCAETLPPYDRKNKLKKLLNNMTANIFVSRQNLLITESQLAMKIKRTHVIRNGPRLRLTAPIGNPARQDNKVNMACVARLETHWKGQDLLLEILSTEVWKNRNWHLNLYGEGPDEAYIASLVKYYGLENRVTLYGYLRDIRDIWHHNDIMVLPSRGEGNPLSVLEAMMCGRPVISTDLGDVSEMIEYGVSGYIADAATIHSFGKIMDRAWREQDRWQAMGTLAHQKAVAIADSDPPRKLLNLIESCQ